MANIPDVNFNKIPDKGVKFNQTEYYESNFDKINEQIVPKVNELDAQLAEKANKVQEESIYPTLLNGWVELGSAYHRLRYYKDSLGYVHIEGGVDGTNALSSIIFDLPTGYNLQKYTYFVCQDGFGTALKSAPSVRIRENVFSAYRGTIFINIVYKPGV